MYINNFLCPYNIKKDENKCSRIFRPWDSASTDNSVKDSSQDSTVSTTTQEDEDVCCKSLEKCKEIVPDSDLVKSKHISHTNQNKFGHKFRSALSPVPIEIQESCQKPLASPQIPPPMHPLPMDFIPEAYNPMYPEIIQTNLAQSLGLPPNDPLLLESFAQGYALEEYARVLNQEQQAKILAAKKQRPKKYKCPHCDVGFSNNGQLKGHIRIHTGERPFKCDDKECGKTFTRNEELTRHKRIHSGLRPFPCTHCGKRFGRKDHLKKHSRTHFQPRGLYAVPVMLPFEAWASGQANGYPFFPVMY